MKKICRNCRISKFDFETDQWLCCGVQHWSVDPDSENEECFQSGRFDTFDMEGKKRMEVVTNATDFIEKQRKAGCLGLQIDEYRQKYDWSTVMCPNCLREVAADNFCPYCGGKLKDEDGLFMAPLEPLSFADGFLS